jgi:hypothetical protein
MAHRMFTCPETSMMVQHWLEDDNDVPDNAYEVVPCPACDNRKTGKLLGEKMHEQRG